MSAIIKIENLRDLIIDIRDESVLLNAEVAQLYGVETRDINQAVANKPNKFPAGYRPFQAKQHVLLKWHGDQVAASVE